MGEHFRESKIFLKVFQKLVVKEFVVNFVLDIFWHLRQYSKICFFSECLILIIFPFIFEMLLYPPLKIVVDWLILIKPFQNTKELGQAISFFKTLVKLP